MRFVDHHEDMRACVQFREGLGKVRFAELVNHRHHEVRGVRTEKTLQLLDTVRHFDAEADPLTRLGQLFFELSAVGDRRPPSNEKVADADTSPSP